MLFLKLYLPQFFFLVHLFFHPGKNETNFPHKILSTDTQAFAKSSSANIKLSKTQLFKMVQSGRCFKYLADAVLRKIPKGAPILAKMQQSIFRVK